MEPQLAPTSAQVWGTQGPQPPPQSAAQLSADSALSQTPLPHVKRPEPGPLTFSQSPGQLVGDSLLNLAIVQQDMGAHDAAKASYSRAQTIYELALGPDHPRVATALHNLALLHQKTGAYAEADALAGGTGLVALLS